MLLQRLDMHECLPTWTIKPFSCGTHDCVLLMASRPDCGELLMLFAIVGIPLPSGVKLPLTGTALPLTLSNNSRHVGFDDFLMSLNAIVMIQVSLRRSWRA
jgi:hypothetical protein